MPAWNFLVDRGDLARTDLREVAVPAAADLAEGEVLLAIERFSLTANNITYGVVGDRLGYWRFFPADGPWGQIPVWGFARVTASRAAGVAPGLRLYGYWPMSTHLVTRILPRGTGFTDASEHRAALPAAYNRYDPAPETAQDDHLALLRPLFTTSFLLDDYLAEVAPGATVIVSSASSRTGLGLAWLLAQRSAPAIGLTSARNRGFVEELALYRTVASYDSIDGVAVDGPVAFVDLAGDAAVRAAVHRRFGDRLALSLVVGSTHHEARAAEPAALPGPVPAFFFAPDRLVQRSKDWGGAVLTGRIATALDAFIAANCWLRIVAHHGPDALQDAYRRVLTGAGNSSDGDIVFPA